ncbi:MAG: TolC family outer membrane protein [Burkholderiaceae bacterium]
MHMPPLLPLLPSDQVIQPLQQRLRPVRALLLASLAFAAHSQVMALSLQQAAELALNNDPQYLAAQKATQGSEEALNQARGGRLPFVSAAASSGKSEIEAMTGAGSTTDLKPRSYRLSISQSLLNFETNAGVRQAEAGLSASQAALENARQQTLLRLARAYFDILAAQDSLSTVRSEKAAIAEQLELAKRSFEVGTATITDQQEAQARFDLVQAREIQAQNTLSIRRNSLAVLIRQPSPERLDGIGQSIAIPSPEPLNIDSWIQEALRASPALMQAQAAAKAAQEAVEKARGAELPSLGLQLSHGRSWESTAPGQDVRSNAVGVELSVPIWQAVSRAATRQAQAAADEAGHQAEFARLSAEQAARTAFLNVTAGLAKVAALEAAETSSKLALASNKLGYEVGVGTNIDVLNAQQQLFAAQRDLFQARYDTLLASLELQAATGQLQLANLASMSELILNSAAATKKAP